MRMAVLADVHGNLPALRAVLEDLRAAAPDLVVNPGSVGMPAYRDAAPVPHAMEAGSPHARYAVLTRTGAGWPARAGRRGLGRRAARGGL